MRRSLLVLAVCLPLVACGGDDGGGGSGEVRTTPVTFGEGDEVWLRVETGGGFVPEIVNLREVPELLLFDDGRLVRLEHDDDSLDRVLPTFEVVHVDEEGAAEVLDRFRQVVDGPDPGTPNVTDLPSTTVEVTTDGETRELTIYALGFEDESLSDAEQSTREAAEAAIADAFDLAGGEPFVPDEWLVETIAVDAADPSTAVPWPLAPGRQATSAEPRVCTRVSGEERDAVLDVLADGDPGPVVTTGREAAEIALRPVLLGDEACHDGFVER